MPDEDYLLKTPITDAQWRHRMELFAGLIKHTMTLDTACILVVATVAGGFFDEPRSHWLMALALMMFVVSLFGCYMVLWVATMHTDETYEDDWSGKKLLKWGFVTGYSGFCVGLFCLAMFVWVNLFQGLNV